jgi:hypothetical protein
MAFFIMIGRKGHLLAIDTMLWASLQLTVLTTPTPHMLTSTNASTALEINAANSTHAQVVMDLSTTSTTSMRITDTRGATDTSVGMQDQVTSTNSFGSTVSSLATTDISTPYFLSTLLAQTSLLQTALVQSAAAKKTTVRIENTVVKIASVMPSSTTNSTSETSLSPPKDAPSASAGAGQGQAQADAADDCTRNHRRDEATAAGAFASCFALEPLPSADSTTTSTTLPASSQQGPPSSLSMTSTRTSTSSSEASSSASSSLLKDGGVSTSSFEQPGVATIATGSQNTTDTVTESIATLAPSSPSDASDITPVALPVTGHPEPTTFRNETLASHASTPVGDTTEKPAPVSVAAQNSSSPGGHGVANATMFPLVLYTVTHTTTICPSSVQAW